MIEEEIDYLQEEVQKHIRKLIKPLKEGKELRNILKVKLTKKEFKVLNAWAYQEELTPLLEKLHLDQERYQQLKEKLIKKLNQEKLKQEIMMAY